MASLAPFLANAELKGYEPEKDVADWMKLQLETEVNRLKTFNTTCLCMSVKNTSVFLDGGMCINRIEVKTGFDFSTVVRMMVSEAVPCPLKPNFSYINLVLFTEKPLPILVPYVYDATYNVNNLCDWLLINSKGERTHQRIEHFEHL